MCGNEIPAAAAVCPFCATPQSVRSQAPSRVEVETCNIKEGKPIAADALRHLDAAVARAQAGGTKVLRIIHGWGSGGVGGVIRDEARGSLKRMKAAGRIRGVVHGEDYGDRTNAGRALLQRCPSLRSALRTDSANPGITFVEL